MRRLCLGLLILTVGFLAASAISGQAVAADTTPVRGQTYVEAEGRGLMPSGASGGWGKLLARRGAMVDLQRNLLRKLSLLQVDTSALPSRLQGFIKGVELFKSEWDGNVYKVEGRVRVEDGHVSVPARGR